MTVRRRGVRRTTQPRFIQSLGRVLVTIDDLAALLKLLEAAHEGSEFEKRNEDDPKVLMEFSGGTFDDPEDLRTLADDELKRIVIKTSKVEVTLAPDSAWATGDPEVARSVYNHWARPRQTKARATKRDPWDYGIPVTSGVFCVIVIVALVATWSTMALSSKIVGGFIFVFCFFVAMAFLRAKPKNFATIRPVSISQYRQERIANNRHLVTATIALAGVVIALGAALIGVLLKK